MATYVLIPGAWLGGWCWDRVAPLLRAAGHQVLTPTLTGLGDRAHASTADVNLRTHVLDVVDLIVHANVRDAILVGHSYGGTVITGAAQEIPERLQWLVFLDASAPRPGESNNDVLPPGLAERLRESARKDGSGFFVPPPPVETWASIARHAHGLSRGSRRIRSPAWRSLCRSASTQPMFGAHFFLRR